MKSIIIALTVELFTLLFNLESVAQVDTTSGGTIKGIVVDEKIQEPIPFVSAVLEGTNQGITTDSNGIFSFSNLPAGTYKLMLSSIGYSTKRLGNLIITEKTIVDLGKIRLMEAGITLKEVTVTPGSFAIMGTITSK